MQLSLDFIKCMVFSQLKFNVCVRCDMTFIVSMHRNKPTITYLHSLLQDSLRYDLKYIPINLHTVRSELCLWYWSRLPVYFPRIQYGDVIMSTMASQITSVSTVYSTVCSNADQRKHQSSAPLAFVRGIHRWPGNSPHKGPVTRKTFPFDDVIMLLQGYRSTLTTAKSSTCESTVNNMCKEWLI